MDDTIHITKSQLPQNRPTSVGEVTSVAGVKKTTLPTIKVKLPSQGFFYPEGSILSSGEIEIFRATAKHEDILQNQQFLKKGTVLDEFLKSMIASVGVNTDDILIGDKNAIFLAARISAYGESYSTKIRCPECGEESKVVIDLSLLKNKEYDFSPYKKGENLFDLKVSNGDTVGWKLLTNKDESLIDSEIKGLQKFNSKSSTEITTRLKYIIMSVNGDSDKGKIKKYIEDSLPAKDALKIRKELREKMPDVDMTVDFECPKCDFSGRVPVPMTSEFLWPSSDQY
jgi:predicted RNA-binding Zn-ribbon protein involved in translation (DUF1610 family)